MHRCVLDGGATVALDFESLADDIVGAIRAWFVDLQTPEAADRRANVAKNLPTLVMAQEQELPLIGGVTFSVTNTCTPNVVLRPLLPPPPPERRIQVTTGDQA